MPSAIVALLLALGCAPASFTGPAGSFAIWVCPPETPEQPPRAPAAPVAPPREERGA